VAPQIDVFIPTYNSIAHLEECVRSARRAVPTRRIVLIDHHSTDGTLDVGRRNGCEIVEEGKGLGYARQLAIELAETDVFGMVESDLVYSEFGWYAEASGMLGGDVGAVVAYVPRRITDKRGKYADFWSRHTPLQGRRHGFSAGSTLFLKRAVAGMKIPPLLNAYEDIYIMRRMREKGWKYKTLEVAGIHHSDFEPSRKARWYGANARRLYSVDPGDVTLLRRQLSLPLLGLVAAFGTRDAGVLAWALSFSGNFLLGWSEPGRYSSLKR
jgi:glycosyltransferase involved in cell wall biosynthesis